MISVGTVFLFLAGLALVGFVLDALFDRLRMASVLPLMLSGVALVLLGIVPPADVALLERLSPYISGFAVAFILFSVGLEMRYTQLARVIGRASGFMFAVQLITGVGVALIAYAVIGWPILLAFVFGFAVSGPSSVIVPRIVRAARLSEGLKTSLLYESVVSDVLELLVPLVLLGLYTSGTVAPTSIAVAVAIAVVGSGAVGLVAGLLWLLALDRLRAVSKGYVWTLTITMVLATYGGASVVGLNAGITIFVFGIILGNALALDARKGLAATGVPLSAAARLLDGVRDRLHLSTGGLDLDHVEQVQREVAFFISTFFFVYLGLLFHVGGLAVAPVELAIGATIVILAVRAALAPILRPYFASEPNRQRAERALTTFNIGRGLSPAVIATIPLSLGLVIPGFLDAIFLVILLTIVVSTAGIVAFYRPKPEPPASPPPAAEAAPAALPIASAPAADPGGRPAPGIEEDVRGRPPPLPPEPAPDPARTSPALIGVEPPIAPPPATRGEKPPQELEVEDRDVGGARDGASVQSDHHGDEERVR